MQTPQTRNKLTASIRASLLGTGAALALTFPASILAAGELDELKKQVEILMQKIETLEAQQKENKADLEKKVVTAGDTKGSYKLPGSNTSVQLGGYIKLDAIYDFDSDLGDTLGVGLVPVDGTETGSHFRAHARQSRLYLKTSTPLSNGKKVKTHFEGDFFGSGGNENISNSRGFRLRHAYGEYGPLLAGQTWSTFMQFHAYPETIDFGGPTGISFVRQAQVRWSQNGFSLALENPEGLGIPNSQDPLPDFVAKWKGTAGNGTYSVAGILRALETDGPAASDTASGGGLNLAGSWKLGSSKVMANVISGEGISRYVYWGFLAPDAFIDGGGSLEAVELSSATLGLQHKWNDTSRSNFAIGHTDYDNDPNGNDSNTTFHLNYLWNPVKKVTFGVELSRAERETINGDGEANRAQFGAKYDF